MIIRLQNGDTINGSKYRKEGLQAHQYQKQKKRERIELIRSRSEMQPKLEKKATVIDKLKGKKDQYSFSPRGVGMSPADPVATFVVSGVALSPLGKLVKPVAKLFKSTKTAAPKYKTRTVTGMDGKQYTIDSTVSENALDSYLTDSMIYSPETYTVPDKYLLEQNFLRELSWAPESTQKAMTQILTTGRTSQPTAVIKLPWRQRLSARRAYNRALKAQEVVEQPLVKNYSNMQAMPKVEMEAHNYKPIAENVQGVHTSSGNYLNDVYAPEAPSVALHEATHGYQELLPYTKQQKELLRNTYLLPRKLKYKDSKSVEEMGALNAQFRKYLADKIGNPEYEQFNQYIKGMSDDYTYNSFMSFKPNGYIEDYKAGLLELSKEQIPQWVQNFKLSQIKVPATIGGGYFIIKQK